MSDRWSVGMCVCSVVECTALFCPRRLLLLFCFCRCRRCAFLAIVVLFLCHRAPFPLTRRRVDPVSLRKHLKDFSILSLVHDTTIRILDILMIGCSPSQWVGYLMPKMVTFTNLLGHLTAAGPLSHMLDREDRHWRKSRSRSRLDLSTDQGHGLVHAPKGYQDRYCLGYESSRLRDRQKEERELSVKRAFIEDIFCENSRLTFLLQKHSCYHAVLWDVDSLPSASKESELCQITDASILISAGKSSPEKDDNVHDFNDLSNYISAVVFDIDDDDLAYNFQIESGTLPCVACGILGFPFMAVVQPSKVASSNLLHGDPLDVSMGSALTSNTFEGHTEDAKDKSESSNKDLHHVDEASLAAEQNQSPLPDGSPSSNHGAVSPKVVNAME